MNSSHDRQICSTKFLPLTRFMTTNNRYECRLIEPECSRIYENVFTRIYINIIQWNLEVYISIIYRDENNASQIITLAIVHPILKNCTPLVWEFHGLSNDVAFLETAYTTDQNLKWWCRKKEHKMSPSNLKSNCLSIFSYQRYYYPKQPSQILPY